MSIQFKYELTDAQANMADNLAVQFKRDIDNCNNGSIETRKRYHKALEDRFAKFLARDFRLENIKNIGPKHIYAYVRFLQENGKSAGYYGENYGRSFACRHFHQPHYIGV